MIADCVSLPGRDAPDRNTGLSRRLYVPPMTSGLFPYGETMASTIRHASIELSQLE
jgi:hypothetical protein